MRIKQIFTMSAVLLLAAGTVRAAHVWEDPGGWWEGHFSYDVKAPRYTGNELSLDLFGSYINPEGQFNKLFETSIEHGHWGGGAGLNYFFTPVLGLGADFNISS